MQLCVVWERTLEKYFPQKADIFLYIPHLQN